MKNSVISTVSRRLADTAASAGIGVLAGLVGTAAMTASSTIEMKLSGREASTTPADAAGKVLDVEPADDEGAAWFGTVVHWGYGVAWGAVRGVLGELGMSGPLAAVTHFGIVWGGEQAVLPATGVSKPVWSYGAAATATDALHHAVYASATSLAYEWFDRNRSVRAVFGRR